MTACLSALTLLTCLAADGDFAFVTSAPPGSVVVARAPAGTIGPLEAYVPGAAGGLALPSQWSPDLPDAPLAFWLPVGTAAETVRLRRSTTPAVAAGGPRLQLSRDGEQLTVTSDSYEVVHRPDEQAGLPSSVRLLPDGPIVTGFNYNDRVYDPTLGGYILRYDPQPTIEVLASGPLRVVIRTTASYLKQDGTAPDSRPQATYTFTYLAGSPRVEVAAYATQTSTFAWQQLHIIEWNFADPPSKTVVGDALAEPLTLSNTEKTSNSRWAGLDLDGRLFGLTCPDRLLIYDGIGGYGFYLHGPWVEWNGLEHRNQVTMLLDGDPRAVARYTAEAPAGTAPATLAALPLDLLESARALRGNAEQRGQAVTWLANLAEQLAKADRVDAAKALLAAVPGAGRVDARAAAAVAGLQALVSADVALAMDGPQLVSFYDLRAGRELLATPIVPWTLQEQRDGSDVLDLPAPAASETKYDPGANALTVTATQSAADGAFVTRFWVKLDGPKATLRLRVLPDSPAALWQVRFPNLRLAQLSVTGADDHVFYPRGPGEVVRDPWQTGAQHGGRYPSGWSTMQYLAHWDPRGGLYVGVEDPVASTKDVNFTAAEGRGSLRFGCDWPVPDMGQQGVGWAQPGQVTLELFRGDWYDAALLYRRWAEAEAEWWPARVQAKATPYAVNDLAVWAQASGHPYEPEDVVARMRRYTEWLGVPSGVHWYNWHEIPFDVQYPHYNPSKPRVDEGTREMRANDVYVMPYINARLWDIGTDDFETVARPAATQQQNGEPYIETYGSGAELAPMCPATDLWQNKVREIVEWLQHDIGVNGVYLDQVAAAAPVLCMNPDHGHPLGGGSWWNEQGYWPLLEKVRATMPPGAFLTTECNGEPFMQYFDGYLTWHWQYNGAVPAFSAVYADQIFMFGRAYRGGDTRDLADRMKTAQALVFGEQLGWIDTGIVDRPAGAFFRDCVRLRSALTPFLSGGRMLRPPALIGDIPEVTADWQWVGNWPVTTAALQVGAWRSRDRAESVIIVANTSDAPVSVDYVVDAAELGFAAGSVLTATPLDAERPYTPERWAAGSRQSWAVPGEAVRAWVVAAAQ